jgi:hypothetical protein
MAHSISEFRSQNKIRVATDSGRDARLGRQRRVPAPQLGTLEQPCWTKLEGILTRQIPSQCLGKPASVNTLLITENNSASTKMAGVIKRLFMQLHAILDGNGQVISIGDGFINPQKNTGSYSPRPIRNLLSLATAAKFIRTHDGQQFDLLDVAVSSIAPFDHIDFTVRRPQAA